MSEATTIETPATVKATKPTPKAKKAAPVKPIKASKPSTNGDMSDGKTVVLKQLKIKEMHMSTLQKRTGLSRRAVYHAVYHLRKEGYIREEQHEDIRERLFLLTAKGRNAVKK